MPIYEAVRQERGYRPSRRSRYVGLGGVILLHVTIATVFIWRGDGLSGLAGHGGAGSGDAAVFELLPATPDLNAGREGGGGDAPRPAPTMPDATVPSEKNLNGEGRSDGPGVARLGEDLDRLLSDDPLSGGGAMDYRALLRRHVALYVRPLTDAPGRGHSGTVILRARLARDGQIVDSRVLRSRGAQLDEAALSALWRSEPLPPVPERFSVPFEVDVSIDFTGPGSTLPSLASAR